MPFNTALKIGSRAREDEDHAIEFARRTLGVPAPKVLSYGDEGPNADGSIWMTIVLRVPANIWWPNASSDERATFVSELNQLEYILRMRQLSSPLKPSPRISM